MIVRQAKHSVGNYLYFFNKDYFLNYFKKKTFPSHLRKKIQQIMLTLVILRV